MTIMTARKDILDILRVYNFIVFLRRYYVYVCVNTAEDIKYTIQKDMRAMYAWNGYKIQKQSE